MKIVIPNSITLYLQFQIKKNNNHILKYTNHKIFFHYKSKFIHITIISLLVGKLNKYNL